MRDLAKTIFIYSYQAGASLTKSEVRTKEANGTEIGAGTQTPEILYLKGTSGFLLEGLFLSTNNIIYPLIYI